MVFTTILESLFQILLTGVPHMVSGQDKLKQSLLLTQDGCFLTATHYSSIMCSQDLKANSQDKYVLMEMTMKAPTIIGFMNIQRIKFGTCLRKLQDGYSGMMDAMFTWLTSQKQDGTLFQTEGSM